MCLSDLDTFCLFWNVRLSRSKEVADILSGCQVWCCLRIKCSMKWEKNISWVHGALLIKLLLPKILLPLVWKLLSRGSQLFSRLILKEVVFLQRQECEEERSMNYFLSSAITNSTTLMPEDRTTENREEEKLLNPEKWREKKKKKRKKNAMNTFPLHALSQALPFGSHVDSFELFPSRFLLCYISYEAIDWGFSYY